MCRCPARSTLFPYTTLFRSLIVGLITCLGVFGVNITAFAAMLGAGGLAIGLGFQGALSNLAAGIMLLVTRRSEEHTSELQSLRHLVCRLLLEKKKNNEHKND